MEKGQKTYNKLKCGFVVLTPLGLVTLAFRGWQLSIQTLLQPGSRHSLSLRPLLFGLRCWRLEAKKAASEAEYREKEAAIVAKS